MKHKSIIALFCLLIATYLQAQTRSDVKLYGYMQPVTPGMVASRDMNEDGTITKRKNPQPSYNYFMYLTAPAQLRLYPSEMWIKGQQYAVNYKAVQSPVEHSNYNLPSNPKKITLVPKTKLKVLQLTATSLVDNKTPLKFKEAAQQNELVVAYKLNGKFYYAILKSFTSLEPQAMQ